MKLRWFIRGFAVAMLVLCLGLWGWSYFRTVSAGYSPSHDKHYSVHTHQGGVLFSSTNIRESFSGWRFTYYIQAFESPNASAGKLFLGFGYFNWPTVPPPNWFRSIGVPFWFPLLLSVGLVWFVWWQTRVKREGRGFPVEVKP